MKKMIALVAFGAMVFAGNGQMVRSHVQNQVQTQSSKALEALGSGNAFGKGYQHGNDMRGSGPADGTGIGATSGAGAAGGFGGGMGGGFQ